jgi:tetratricopeptide (TPR) repeat protein
MRLFLALFSFVGLLHAEAWLVLPLLNKSGKKNLNWIGEAPAEAIRRNFAAHGVMVIGRADRQEAELRLALRPNAEWTIASILKLAETLDSTHVVFGDFEVTPGEAGGFGRVKLNARILAVHEFAAKGKSSVEGPLEDLEGLQHKLAYETLRAGGVAGLPGEAAFLESNPKRKITAIENFVRGLLTEDTAQRQKFFEQALKIEPRYGQAAFRLGELLVEREAFGQAVQYLDRVQRPDPNYWQATFLAGVARFEMGEYRMAAQAFDRVAREVPLSEVVNNLGVAQFRAGLVEAVDTLRRSLEGDEKDADYHFNLGLTLMSRGAWAQAADEFRAVLDRDANDAEATKMLGRCLRPPASVTPDTLAELHESARLKMEFNEFAFRQLKSFFQKPAKP